MAKWSKYRLNIKYLLPLSKIYIFEDFHPVFHWVSKDMHENLRFTRTNVQISKDLDTISKCPLILKKSCDINKLILSKEHLKQATKFYFRQRMQQNSSNIPQLQNISHVITGCRIYYEFNITFIEQ